MTTDFGEGVLGRAVRIGDLIEAGDMQQEAGFTVPVLITERAWDDCVSWNDHDDERTGAYQDQTGRLWDVLFMTCWAIRKAGPGSDGPAPVELFRVPRQPIAGEHPEVAQPAQLIACPVAELTGAGVVRVIVIALPDELGQGVLSYGCQGRI